MPWGWEKKHIYESCCVLYKNLVAIDRDMGVMIRKMKYLDLGQKATDHVRFCEANRLGVLNNQ